MNEYDSYNAVRARKYIPPSFDEVRQILDLAQVSKHFIHLSHQLQAIKNTVKLITFDADGTIYEDGANLEKASVVIQPIVELMKKGIHVAIVTAAGYPRDPLKYEQRLGALLERMRDLNLPFDVVSKFHVVGGESNYLFR